MCKNHYCFSSYEKNKITLRRGLFIILGFKFAVENWLKFASEKLSVYQNSIERVSNLCFVTWNELDRKVTSQFVTMDYGKSSRTINFNVTLVEVLWGNITFRTHTVNPEGWELSCQCHIRSDWTVQLQSTWSVESNDQFVGRHALGTLWWCTVSSGLDTKWQNLW